MKVVILGAGALGSVIACKLASTGNDVTLVDVVPSIIEAVQKQGGFIYEDSEGPRLIKLKACYYDDLSNDMELVILLTKTMHSEAAISSVLPHLGENTYFMTLQNGLGNIERIEKYVPLDRIIVGTTLGESNQIAPGHVYTSGSAPTSMMSANGIMNPMVQAVADMFNSSGIETSIEEDILASIWEKVAFNCATNTIASVCRLCDKYTLGTEEASVLAFKIAHEVCTVANAAGYKADEEKVFHKLSTSWKIRGDHFPSMAQDVFAHRRTEIDSINGAVYAKALELGIEVPYVETMYRLVRCIEQNYEAQYLT